MTWANNPGPGKPRGTGCAGLAAVAKVEAAAWVGVVANRGSPPARGRPARAAPARGGAGPARRLARCRRQGRGPAGRRDAGRADAGRRRRGTVRRRRRPLLLTVEAGVAEADVLDDQQRRRHILQLLADFLAQNRAHFTAARA